jgi:DNA-binding NarL/FixJ family response regulator
MADFEMYSNATNGEEPAAWIVSGNEVLIDRIKPLLLPLTGRVQTIDAEQFDEEAFWSPRPPAPGLIVLDIDHRVDWGVSAIHKLRQARIRAPIVVMTEDFSHEFGAKILSEGVRYYFAHDFCRQEFRDLAESLLKSSSRNVR